MNHSLIRTTLLSATLAATLLSAAGCIIVAGNGRGYSSSSWSEDNVSEVRTITIAHVADAPLDVRTHATEPSRIWLSSVCNPRASSSEER
ncbi:MAG: hypothetical protein NTV94_14740 [Planctomycetota bacterium]|nr:hypothetical protein [Planctomycetota bacterium]